MTRKRRSSTQGNFHSIDSKSFHNAIISQPLFRLYRTKEGLAYFLLSATCTHIFPHTHIEVVRIFDRDFEQNEDEQNHYVICQK